MSTSTSIPQQPKYISAETLASLLRSSPSTTSSPPPTTTFCSSTPASDPTLRVIDVRDDDFRGGNIAGALNHPSLTYSPSAYEELAKELTDQGVDKVVFHCMLSQVRGPKAASRYAQALHAVDPSSSQEVLILNEGFQGFQKVYKNDPKLVEKYIKVLWE